MKSMSQPSAKAIWCLNQQEFVNLIDSKTFMQKNRKIQYYVPSFTYDKNNFFCSQSKSFPTISVTGNSCALNCKHCEGKVLSTMQATITPDELVEFCSKYKQDGAVGCLISGGCLLDGSVPLKLFVSAIARVKRELGLIVFVHAGIVDLEMAVLLKHAGVDAVLVDVVGSQETISNVCRLNVTVQDYVKSLNALQEAGLDFVPHVVVGLNGGKLDGEFVALQMILQSKPSAVVVIAFMPLRGTEMANVDPPQPLDIARVVASARVMFPHIPLVLGCMRPKGKLRRLTDVLALKAGVDAIAFPSQEAIDFAKTQNWSISFSPFCCAKIFTEFNVKDKVE
jgi:uncharacterized radical SAM superfamily protein